MTGTPLVAATALVVAGILLGLQRPVPLGDGPLAFLLAALAIGTAVAAVAGVRFRRSAVALLLAGAGLALGLSAGERARRQCTAVIPADVPVEVAGVLESAAGSRLRIRLDSATVAGRGLPCGETVPARWSGHRPSPGAPVIGTGRWWRASGGVGALRAAGVLVLDTLGPAQPAMEAGAPPGRAPPRARLAAARSAAAARLEALYGPRAPLAASLLIAHRDGIDRELRDRFARAGLSHLLAISGLHVGLVAGVLLLLGGVARLRAPWRAGLAGAGTVAYVLFLGAPPAASRAALQVVLLLAGSALQRPARPEALLATAALALLAADPVALLDPGFQLSFAGVAGLLLMRRPLLARMRPLAERPLGGVAAGKWVADALASGLAATLATAPIVAWHFGRVSLIGVLANLPAIPLVGALVPALALSLGAAAVAPPLGEFLAGAGGALLAGLEAVARAAAAVPGGSMGVGRWSATLWTTAAVAAYLGSRRLGRVRARVRAVVAAGLAAAVLTGSALRIASDRVEIHVIDVGQGDAIALRSPAGRWLLVDAGLAGPDHDMGERRVVPYLSARGVRRLEGLVLTHPHADHFGGAGAVVRALAPRWVGDPGVGAANPAYADLLESAAAARIPWVALRAGVDLDLDGVTVEFLHPWGADRKIEDPNDISVIMRVAYGAFSALLTGDAPAAVEEALVARLGRELEAEVLKAGHHGSSTSTSGALLGATGADLALISAGRGNRYGHPHPGVLARLDSAGVRVLRTDRQGTIVIRGSAAGEIRVSTERGDP